MATPQALHTARLKSRPSPTPRKRRSPKLVNEVVRGWWRELEQGHPELPRDFRYTQDHLLAWGAKTLPRYFCSAMLLRQHERACGAEPMPVDLSAETLRACLAQGDCAPTGFDDAARGRLALILNVWLSTSAGYLAERYGPVIREVAGVPAQEDLAWAFAEMLRGGRLFPPVFVARGRPAPGELWRVESRPYDPVPNTCAIERLKALGGDISGTYVAIPLHRGVTRGDLDAVYQALCKELERDGTLSLATRGVGTHKNSTLDLARYRDWWEWQVRNGAVPAKGKCGKFDEWAAQGKGSHEAQWSTDVVTAGRERQKAQKRMGQNPTRPPLSLPQTAIYESPAIALIYGSPSDDGHPF